MDANEPFLPPRQPSDNNAVQPAPKQAKRTLLLWLLLIVMFLGIYWLFNDPKPHRRAAPPRDASCAPCEKSNPLYPWLPSLGFGFLIFFFLRRQFRGGTKFNERLEPGLLALADGSFAQAAELLRAVEAQYTKNTSYAAAAALSLAEAQIHQGALAQAIQTLARAERGAGLMYGSDVRIQAAIDLTRAYALRGETEVAERWAADVRKRLQRGDQRIWRAGRLRLAEALLAARRGDAARAAQLLDAEWPRLEYSLSLGLMREAWLLRAFVADGEQRGQAEAWLRLLRGGRRGQLDHLGVEWPEMRTFLVTHDLATHQ